MIFAFAALFSHLLEPLTVTISSLARSGLEYQILGPVNTALVKAASLYHVNTGLCYRGAASC